MKDKADIPSRVQELAARIAQPQPMRRGSLSERYVKCSKPGCACAGRPDARHGPYYSLTRGVGGQTQSRFLTPEQAEIARHQVQLGRQFRKDVEALWEACEQWADGELEGKKAASKEAAKKGASQKPSRRKSSERSKRS
jgi:hypothetical protein